MSTAILVVEVLPKENGSEWTEEGREAVIRKFVITGPEAAIIAEVEGRDEVIIGWHRTLEYLQRLDADDILEWDNWFGEGDYERAVKLITTLHEAKENGAIYVACVSIE